MQVNIIVAVALNGAIGDRGNLLWHIPEDLKRFKAITSGHPVIMGRKTWESLPKRPLPGRKNIVLTRNKDFKAEGAEVVTTPEEAISRCGKEDCFIIGGDMVYRLFLPYSSRLYATIINDIPERADAFFEYDLKDWNVEKESPLYSTKEGVEYKFVDYIRKG